MKLENELLLLWLLFLMLPLLLLYFFENVSWPAKTKIFLMRGYISTNYCHRKNNDPPVKYVKQTLNRNGSQQQKPENATKEMNEAK